jgi:hypothetical protein
MKIQGRRITIAGSAAANSDEAQLQYAHDLVRELVLRLSTEGALFGVGIGKEPYLADDKAKPSIIFDWNVLETLGAELKKDAYKATSAQGKLISLVTTDKTSLQIPAHRQALWNELLKLNCVHIRSTESGWASGALRRQMQAELGDVLIAVSGGEGVEHLAKEFALQGKPVIPVNLQLGSSGGDGTGGSAKLYSQMKAHPERFARFEDLSAAGSLLASMDACQGTAKILDVVEGIISLLKGFKPPRAFFVRLLNASVPDFNDVEAYFKNVVVPLVTEYGYEPVQMGKAKSEHAWMEVEIFEMLYNAATVVVDLTGLRHNCFTEMGYAFGRARKVIVTAKHGTVIPFDTGTYEAVMWNPANSAADNIAQLKDYWQRNISRPPLVVPKSIL